MSYESDAEPIKLGYLFDFRLPEGFPRSGGMTWSSRSSSCSTKG